MSSNVEVNGANVHEQIVKVANSECKVYKMRWVILGLFVLSSAASIMQWVQFTIIADVVVKYYGVSYESVNWSAMIYLAAYIVFVFPGMYIADKVGLRLTVLLGVGWTCVGSWIKIASVSPDRFWVVLLGQGIVGSSEVFLMGLPPRVAAVWFGPNEVSSACSIGIFGTQLGIAVGFLLPPMMVTDQEGVEGIEYGLELMLITVAVINSVMLLVLFVCFKAEPPTPPSPAQAQTKSSAKLPTFSESLKQLLFNPSYILLLSSYGINVGVFYALSTLLNEIILDQYPNANEDAGRIGLLMVIAGMVGSVSCGVILDKFHRFKETILTVQGLCLASMVAFAFTLKQGLVAVYLVSALLGFFMTGLFSLGFELAAELTYPIPEDTSAGLLVAVAQLFGIGLTYLYSFLYANLGDLWTNLAISVILLLSFFLIACIRFDLRRQAAQNNNN